MKACPSTHRRPAPRRAPVPGRVERALVLSALPVLAAGLLLYWVARDVSHTLLIPRFDRLQAPGSLQAVAGWLPSLLHTLGFGLLTAAAVPPRPAWRLGAIGAWAAINLAFEIGQHPALSGPLAESLLGGPQPGLVSRALAGYFRHGRFDADDLAATLAGASIALAWWWRLDRPRRHDHEP